MMRGSIVVVGAIATYMALTVHSIYGLWYLSSDLVFVILFPQLVCVVYYKKTTNTYGSLAAYIVGLSLRALGGEAIIGLPPIIKYPFYDADRGGQLFPFRTLAMVSSAFTIVGVSRLTIHLFETGKLAPHWDYFGCVVNVPDDVVVVQDPHEELAVLSAGTMADYQTGAEMNGRVNPGLEDDAGAPLAQDLHEPIPLSQARNRVLVAGEKVRRRQSEAIGMKGSNPGDVLPSISSVAKERAGELAAAAGRGSIKVLNKVTRRPSEVAYVATQL